MLDSEWPPDTSTLGYGTARDNRPPAIDNKSACTNSNNAKLTWSRRPRYYEDCLGRQAAIPAHGVLHGTS